MKRKILAFVLSTTILSTVFTPINVGATNKDIISNETLSESEKSNFNFIETSDLSDVEYTYQENNKTYLVKENANQELTIINTEIYEVTEESNVLIDKYTTSIEKDNDMLIISKNDEGIVTNSYVDIKEGQLNIQNNKISLTSINTGSKYNGTVQYDYINHKYYTTWLDTNQWNGSNTVSRFSLTVVIGMLSGISGNPVVMGGVTAAAQWIVDHSIPEVYWTSREQSLWEITYPGLMYLGSPVGIKTYVTFYSDSSRTNVIGNDLKVWHDPVYWPSQMGW